ncbi:hypothetical protein GF373_00190 [bacterium]|nr:hypothetical protein [bacterium]
MACVNPDGSLSETAKGILKSLETPRAAQDIAAETKQPLFVVRSALREMKGAGLVEENGDQFTISAEGREAIQE